MGFRILTSFWQKLRLKDSLTLQEVKCQYPEIAIERFFSEKPAILARIFPLGLLKPDFLTPGKF